MHTFKSGASLVSLILLLSWKLVCVCTYSLLPSLLITSSWIWHDMKYIKLVKNVLHLHMAPVAGIINSCGFRIEVRLRWCCRSCYFHFKSTLRQLYISNMIKHGALHLWRWVCHTCIKEFKEDLAWAIDKWFQLINIVLLFKTVIPLRNWRIKSF